MSLGDSKGKDLDCFHSSAFPELWAAMLNSRNTDPSCGQLVYYYIIKLLTRSIWLLIIPSMIKLDLVLKVTSNQIFSIPTISIPGK